MVGNQSRPDAFQFPKTNRVVMKPKKDESDAMRLAHCIAQGAGWVWQLKEGNYGLHSCSTSHSQRSGINGSSQTEAGLAAKPSVLVRAAGRGGGISLDIPFHRTPPLEGPCRALGGAEGNVWMATFR